jgi:hypothetical protein
MKLDYYYFEFAEHQYVDLEMDNASYIEILL